MRHLLCATVAALLAATPVSAARIQDEVNAAQAAFDAGKFEDAVRGYRAALGRINPSSPQNRIAAGILRGRLGIALARVGQPEAAATELEIAIAALDGPDNAAERGSVRVDLGRVRENLLDYAAARQAYEGAIADAGPGASDDRLFWARMGLARVTTISDPAAARRALDATIPVAERVLAGANGPDTLGDLYALRGRVELNAGNMAEARSWFEKALKAAGGMGTRVTIADTRIRGDLALAYHLDGRREQARKYLAYTGAGRLREGSFSSGADTMPPACGPTTGIEPDDVAVIEFAVSGRGIVTAVTPIYVSRPGIEMEFLRAVKRWSWKPETLAEIPPFWRAAIRLEIRCQGSDQGPSHLSRGFAPLMAAWYRLKALTPPPVSENMSDAQLLPLLQAELARREQALGRQSPELLPVLDALAANRILDEKERDDALRRRVEIAEASGAPPEVSGAMRVTQATWNSVASYRGAGAARLRDRLNTIIAGLSPDRAARARAWAQVELGQLLEHMRDMAGAGAAYQAVLATDVSRLSAGDPIRQAAQLRVASLAAAAGQIDRARALIAETGLTPEQCALVDLQPVQTRRAGGAMDFPEEAMRWGFDGWARIAYDVDTAGRPVAVRTVLAYPPLIFGDASEGIVKRFRFRPIFRDGTNVGCIDKLQSFSFKSMTN